MVEGKGALSQLNFRPGLNPELKRDVCFVKLENSVCTPHLS